MSGWAPRFVLSGNMRILLAENIKSWSKCWFDLISGYGNNLFTDKSKKQTEHGGHRYHHYICTAKKPWLQISWSDYENEAVADTYFIASLLMIWLTFTQKIWASSSFGFHLWFSTESLSAYVLIYSLLYIYTFFVVASKCWYFKVFCSLSYVLTDYVFVYHTIFLFGTFSYFCHFVHNFLNLTSRILINFSKYF